ncbi:MAG: hypothetical protein MI974_12815 [Chitinophagales bacterium]|nr:hypothetical protein [Chitinophagales bacterium]
MKKNDTITGMKNTGNAFHLVPIEEPLKVTDKNDESQDQETPKKKDSIEKKPQKKIQDILRERRRAHMPKLSEEEQYRQDSEDLETAYQRASEDTEKVETINPDNTRVVLTKIYLEDIKRRREIDERKRQEKDDKEGEGPTR